MKDVKYEIVKAHDLIKKVKSEPEVKFLWKGIPEGSVGLITGVSKTGKTTFAENLAICLAIGKPMFFGCKMDGIPKKVLFINLEESYQLRTRRMIKQIDQLDAEETETLNANYFSTPENFPEFINNENDWITIENYIKECDPDVIIIDSLTHLISGSIEKSSVVQAFIQQFRKHVTYMRKSVIIIHHNTKGNIKAIEQDDIAGSRVVLQEFEYAFGLANIPNGNGGNYACMLYNKHIAKDDTTAITYMINEDGWVENLDEVNKYDLYNEKSEKFDNRYDPTNKNKLLEYFLSQDSHGNQIVKTENIISEFVDSKEMSKETLHKSLKKLLADEEIQKIKRGEYVLMKNVDEVLKVAKEGGSNV